MKSLANRFLEWFDEGFDVFCAVSLITLGILFVLVIIAGILEVVA